MEYNAHAILSTTGVSACAAAYQRRSAFNMTFRPTVHTILPPPAGRMVALKSYQVSQLPRSQQKYNLPDLTHHMIATTQRKVLQKHLSFSKMDACTHMSWGLHQTNFTLISTCLLADDGPFVHVDDDCKWSYPYSTAQL